MLYLTFFYHFGFQSAYGVNIGFELNGIKPP